MRFYILIFLIVLPGCALFKTSMRECQDLCGDLGVAKFRKEPLSCVCAQPRFTM